MSALQSYADFAPTGFDSAGAFLEDQQDWLVAPVGLNRDSGALESSNWNAFLASLPGPEGGAWDLHRFGHWACGWFEVIILRPGSAAVGVGEEAQRALEDYPVLDESDLSDREFEDACESWDAWGLREAWGALAALLPEPAAEALAWDEDDTDLSLEHTAGELKSKLHWPHDTGDVEAWRSQWGSAFTRGHRETIEKSKDLAVELAGLAQRIRARITHAIALETQEGKLRKLMSAF